MAIRIVATGQRAARIAHDLASSFGPIDYLTQSGTRVHVQPGTIDVPNNLCILGQCSAEVYALRGSRLEASLVGEFVNGYFVGDVITPVYRSTHWIVPVGQVVMAFAMAVTGGFIIAGVAMVGVNMVQLAVKGYVVYQRCPGQVGTATRELPRVLAELSWFGAHCPRFFDCLENVMAGAELRAMRDYRPGATDIAELLGSLLAGGLASHATEFGFKGLAILFGEAALSVGQSAAQGALPSAAHEMPGALTAGGVDAEAYIRVFRQRGSLPVPENIARDVRRELRQPEVGGHVHALQSSLRALAPAMAEILRRWPSA